MSSLGNYLHFARTARGLHQSFVAKKLGYTSAQFISNVELGKADLPLKKVKKLARILKVPTNVLFKKAIEQKELRYKTRLKDNVLSLEKK